MAITVSTVTQVDTPSLIAKIEQDATRIAELEGKLARKNERAAFRLLDRFLDTAFIPRTGFGSVASPAQEHEVATVLKGLLPSDSPVAPLLSKVLKAWDAHDALDTLRIARRALEALYEA